MSDIVQEAAALLTSEICVPCTNCGLRFGSCAHTRQSEPLLNALVSIVRQIATLHPMVSGPQGPQCKTCKTPGECPTRKAVVVAIHG